MNFKIFIICFLLVIKLNFGMNEFEEKNKTSDNSSLSFIYNISTLQSNETQINIEVKMNNVSFISDHISFYISKEDCVENDPCGNDKCKEKETTTLKKNLTISEDKNLNV